MLTGKRSRLAGVLVLALVVVPPLAAAPAPKGEVEVLSGTDSSTVDVDLAPLQPMSEGLRAILAFYALRANGGCPPGTWSDDFKTYSMQCPLPTALGLGDQCSPRHLALVKSWFKDAVPPLRLSKKTAAEVVKTGKFASICNATPDGATHQTIWSSIRVRRDGDSLVTVSADGAWTNGPGADDGFFQTVATYRIHADRIEVVRYREN